MLTILDDTVEIKETLDYLTKFSNYPGTAFVLRLNIVAYLRSLLFKTKKSASKGISFRVKK